MTRLPPSLAGLAAVLQPVTYRHRDGDALGLVPPPTVRQWVEIRAAALEAAQGEESDLWALVDLLDAWLPPEVIADLLQMEAPAFFRRVVQLLDAHARRALEALTPPGQGKNTTESQRESPFEVRLAVWDYCQAAGGADPWGVYARTPWPFFLAMTLVRDAATARDLLRWAEVEILPHVGKNARAALQSLRARASLHQDRETGPAYAAPEVIERDRAILTARFGVRGKG